MALTSIRLQNFKCYANSGAIPPAPLTVIFGGNNTGKSSILQSLLLLRQTLDSPEYAARLNLRGTLYPAGSYADIVHQHRTKEHVIIELGIVTADGGKAGDIQLEFSSDEPQPPRLARLRIEASSVEPLEIHRGVGYGGPYELVIGEKTIGGEKKANFRFPVNQLLPVIGEEELPRVGRPNIRHQRSRAFARQILRELEGTLRQMKAVGAFRHQPVRRYEYLGRSPDVVDAVGEYMVNALIEDATRRGKRRGELLRSVNRWLNAVGRVRLMPLKRISRAARIFEIRLRDTDSGRWANFADVGFGIGQAFPVLVEGLRTPPGGLFIVQEPEIHLHPDAQLRMADFLVSLARAGKRVIAETHSEYLLLRIRRSIIGPVKARGTRPRLAPHEVSIIHVEKRSDGTSHAQPLEIDELGQIKKWPRGFMEEATEERMAIMKEMAKRAGTRS